MMREEFEQEERNQILESLAKGQAPKEEKVIREISVGIDFLTDFLKEKYLQEYIWEGGSKIKFVTGRSGSGKTHFLKLFSSIAKEEAYICVNFSAKEIWIHDFKEIYTEILKQSDILTCLSRCCDFIVKEMGFDPTEIEEGKTFLDYLSSQNLADAITKRELRLQLKKLFLENPLIDNNFALACSLLAGSMLGHPVLEEHNKDILLQWMVGDKTVKLSALRSLGLSPCKITKYNARHMLRSLTEIVRFAGYSGIVVTVDHVEILLSKSSLDVIHYTKIKREDTYESMRQLIDEIDSLKHIMFFFSFDKDLLENDNLGIKSYQALWMRIQNEIVGERFNRFTDIIDLDKLAEQEYTEETLLAMAKKVADFVNPAGGNRQPIRFEQATEIFHRAKLGAIPVPRLLMLEIFGGVDTCLTLKQDM